jgi:hypothetical protein
MVFYLRAGCSCWASNMGLVKDGAADLEEGTLEIGMGE